MWVGRDKRVSRCIVEAHDSAGCPLLSSLRPRCRLLYERLQMPEPQAQGWYSPVAKGLVKAHCRGVELRSPTGLAFLTASHAKHMSTKLMLPRLSDSSSLFCQISNASTNRPRALA